MEQLRSGATEEPRRLTATLAALTTFALVGYEDATAGAAWLFDGTTFWTFDDPPVMTAEAQYVARKHLGGMMFWELSGDPPNGELIAAIANGLG